MYNRLQIGTGEEYRTKKIFTKKEIEILSKNPYVKSVSPKDITYTDEFKELFIAQKRKGKVSK
jgi:transposase